MFSFGFFSTHIPYLVFFCFYLTYFFYSFKSAEKKEFLEEFFFGKKELVVNAENQIDEEAYFYGELNPDVTPGVFQKSEFQFITNQIIHGPGDRISIARFYERSGQIVNRPPPYYI